LRTTLRTTFLTIFFSFLTFGSRNTSPFLPFIALTMPNMIKKTKAIIIAANAISLSLSAIVKSKNVGPLYPSTCPLGVTLR
jgi:hypothetical protein